jgi:hypothetical protein
MPFPQSPKRGRRQPNGAGDGLPGGSPWQVQSNALHHQDQQDRYNPAQGLNKPLRGGGGFNKNAAGGKSYGMGRSGPNMGKTTKKAGYGKRDAMNARANAIKKKLGGM